MRSMLGILVALHAALLATAADTKPNVLTAKEIADGWLLLFDGESAFGWKTTGDVRVGDGMLTVGGPKESTIELTTGFGEYDLEVEYQTRGDGRSWHAVKHSAVPTPGMGFLPSKEPGWYRATFAVRIDPKTGEQTTEYRYYSPANERRHQSRGEEKRGSLPNFIRFSVDPGGQLLLRTIKLRPHGLQSVFNGKDLTGWKEHPGRKSKFSVTKEGWLNVKDGPGDLQTEGQWGDFVLQLECISNGQHLNSGIFFRCRPGEYQQGYEAQIRNQFTEGPTQPYLVEEYDPKTGELKGKQKVMSPAVDYGTGAIYRRQPARKGVAKDGEWFTLTMAAHGRHLATWVNGVQVADWTDYRKLSDNARNGCRLEKGPLSIQGHDPTTDLSFRNLRVIELPAAKK